ncbi:MAG: monooxygenase [Hyphomicrobiales bacterium]|nr:MAG: monooxygenase [Hyphomicrobiales bacterium]
MERHIAIAGAGIGGLAAALSLAKVGMRVTVLERAPALHEVGAGLQISPNASRILIDLGLHDALKAVAVAPLSIRIHAGRSAHELNHVNLGENAEKRYGAPYWSIHRGELQAVLGEAARANPNIDLRLGAAVVDANEDASGVTVMLEGPDIPAPVTADALVAADGVWSKVRANVLKLPGAAFTGRTAWRALLPIEAAPAQFRFNGGLWIGPSAHLVHYPVSGGTKFNIVAIVKDDWNEEGWSAPGDPAVLLRRFANWAPLARAVLSLPDEWLKWALCGMPPAGQPWHRGRVALLGDAAHAMLPFAAQGAAMAIEDGAILAQELGSDQPVEAALSAYEHRRRPRVERVVATALENDKLYHASGPAAHFRDAGLRVLGSRMLLARYDWIYSWRP